MKKIFIVLPLSFLLFACGGSDNSSGPTPVNPQIESYKPEFILDGQSGLFENFQWYSYDRRTHYIWTNFDVYQIKTQGQIFKLQILNFYNPENTAEMGYYTLRIEGDAGEFGTYVIEAKACGVPQSNPDYANCIKDPAQNTFTYFDIKSGKIWKMSESIAVISSDWTMAFKNDEILLNSGDKGLGDVLGAVLYKDPKVKLPNGQANFERLVGKLRDNFDMSTFSAVEMTHAASYYPVNGQSKVIDVASWAKDSSGNDKANTNNWWLVRSRNSDAVYSFRATDIQKVDAAVTKLQFEVARVEKGVLTKSRVIEFDVDSQKMNQLNCIVLASAKDVPCNAQSWDLQIDSGSQWSVSTANGAIGPVNKTQLLELIQRL